MTECPHCGASVPNTAGVCDQCGETLSSPGQQTSHEQHAQHGDSQQPEQSGQYTGRQNQTPSGQTTHRRQQRGNRAGQNPPQHAQTTGQGTSRRQLLLYGGGIAGVVGGIYLLTGQDDESDGGSRVTNSPESVVREFHIAVSNANREKAESLTPDGTTVEDVMGPAYTFSWGVDMEVQNVETSEKDDERASVVIDFVNLETDYQDSDSYIVTKPGRLWRVLEYNPI